MSRKQEKWMVYAMVITEALSEVVKEHDEDLGDEENLTHFMHALANVAPAYVFNKITEREYGYLEFNHLANQLCFQFMKMAESKEA